ncbi:hypothetical protein Tco_1071715 [Tanacetum coccineum]
MTMTREDYGSGIARPKIDDKAHFKLKGQFLKELRDNTFSGEDNEDANEHIKKVLEIVDLFHIPKNNETSTRTRSTDISDGLAAIQTQLNNIGREIKKVNKRVYATQVGCESCNRPHCTKDCPIKEDGKQLKKRTTLILEYHSPKEEDIKHLLRDSTKGIMQILQTNPRDHVKSISKTVDTEMPSILQMDLLGSATYIKSFLREKPRMGYQIKASTYMNDSAILEETLPPKEKDPGSLGELAPTKLIVELADRTIKRPNGVAKNILVGIDKFVFPVDFIVLDMPEDIKLRRNQVEDLGPTIKDGEVIDEPMIEENKTRNDYDEKSNGIDEYPSFCDIDRKIHNDCDYNLQFSCMIGFEHVNANFFPILSINIMSKRFFNSIMKDKIVFEGKNVVGAFINVPIFVRNFSVIAGFAVLENMNAYRDEGMGDILVGKLFCREICIKARRFDGMITIYNGKDSVTYQMTRSHPRFKHLTNAQCNKMQTLLKISIQDEMNGISHPYQKLKSFYKGVLNLGPEYIRDEKVEEWLTRVHVSIHEME